MGGGAWIMDCLSGQGKLRLCGRLPVSRAGRCQLASGLSSCPCLALAKLDVAIVRDKN